MSVRKRAFQGCAAVAVAALALTACGSSGDNNNAAPSSKNSDSSAPSKAPLKIGVLGTFSGFASDTSKSDPAAVQAWASMKNAAGGLDGHPVQVFVEDDTGSPAQSLVAAKKLVESDHVAAIVGVLDSGLEGTWASYVASKHVPVIGGEATGAPWLTDPNFFPSSLTPINGLTMTAYAAKLANATTYGIVYCAEAPACAQAVTLTKPLAPKLGISFVGGYSVEGSASNYTSQCLALKGKGANSIFLATAEPTWVRFMQSCAGQGYKPLPIAQSGNWTPELLQNPNFANLWMMSPDFSWVGTSPAIKEFTEAMKKYQPSAGINGAATAGWAASVLLGNAAAHLSDTPTSDDIYKGLYSLGPNFSADGLIPPVTFTQGKPAAQQPCAAYLQVSGGELVSPKAHGFKQVCLSS